MHADPHNAAAEFASNTGNVIYLGAALGLPLLRDGHNGKNHTLREVDTLGVSLGIAELLKDVVRERRPDGSSRDSFPSGHATAAFAVAAMESQWHRREAPFWYLGASLIGASRTTLDRHYEHDVIAGALIGYGTARLELESRHGLILAPLITPDRHFGITLSGSLR